MRTKEEPYKANGLSDAGLAEDALIEAIIANPVLMERPPETVLEIL
jgi:arsenate reductase-like glutaredoxin family protein